MPEPECEHPAVVISVVYTMRSDLHSYSQGAASRDMVRIGPPRMSNGMPVVLYVRCQDCGERLEYTLPQFRTWPAWLKRHWANVVAAGGLARQLADHYHTQEAPCPQP